MDTKVYRFTLDYSSDIDVRYAEPASKVKREVEFTEILKQEEGMSKKRYKKIERSTAQLNTPKPRNMFMIFRSMVKSMISEQLPDAGFTDRSKISSMLWAERTPELEKYVKYLAKQEEKYLEDVYLKANTVLTVENKRSMKRKVRPSSTIDVAHVNSKTSDKEVGSSRKIIKPNGGHKISFSKDLASTSRACETTSVAPPVKKRKIFRQFQLKQKEKKMAVPLTNVTKNLDGTEDVFFVSTEDQN